MTQATLTAIPNPTTPWQAAEYRFRGQLFNACEAIDDDLAKAALETVDQFGAERSLDNNDEYHDARAEKALALLKLIEVDKDHVRPNLLATHRALWRVVLEAYRFAESEGSRKKHAQTLQDLTPVEQPHSGQFETVFREVFRARFPGCGPDFDLLRWGDATGKSSLLRKAFQAIGNDASLSQLIFAAKCLAALDGKGNGHVPAKLRLIETICVEFIEHMEAIAVALPSLRSTIQDALPARNETTISILEKGGLVQFHCKFFRFKFEEGVALDEIRYTEEQVLSQAVEFVKRWRQSNCGTPAFRVEIWIHLMPANWKPGTHATAEQSLSRSC